MTSSPPPNLISVKSMISIFENQSYAVNNEPTRLKQRTKSVDSVSVNINSSPVKHSVNTSTYSVNVNNYSVNANSYSVKKHQEYNASETDLELAHIEQQIQHLQRSLSNYKVYSRDNHIYYQNQIFFLLTDLVNVETKSDEPDVINQKSEMIELLKRLNKGLTNRLPPGAAKHKPEVVVSKVTKPIEEKPKEQFRKIEKQETPKEQLRKIEKQETPKEKLLKIEKQETVEQDAIEEETETPALSVRSLKKLFERADSVPAEVPKVTLSRAYKSFSGTADTKYIPYSERFKSKEAESSVNNFASNNVEIFENSRVVAKQVSIDQPDEELNNGFANGEGEDSSPDSPSDEESNESSSGDSDDEANEQSDKDS